MDIQAIESILRVLNLSLIDGSMVLVGAIFFVILWALLNKVLFGPYLKLIEAREGATSGAEHSAAQLENRSSELLSTYEKNLFDARVRAMEKKLIALGEARKVVSKDIEQATADAQKEIRAARAQIAKTATDIRQGLAHEADVIASEIVAKIKSGGRVGAQTTH